ncbi:formylaminopyrimidine deformylase [Microdochium nivale]|nr:formylaminopyrimidine deformylase [Microdochium nivale]
MPSSLSQLFSNAFTTTLPSLPTVKAMPTTPSQMRKMDTMSAAGNKNNDTKQRQQQPLLTDYLLALQDTAELYPRATQSRFLELAGAGRLPRGYLSQWLSQDRLYAQAYVRFIGGLISLVELPYNNQQSQQVGGATVGSSSSSGGGGGGGGEKARRSQRLTETLEWRILEMLKDCLDNILRELAFFEDTAAEYGIDLSAGVADAGGAAVAGGGQQDDSDAAGQSGNNNNNNNNNKSSPPPTPAFGPNETTQGYINLFDSFGGRATAASSATGKGGDDDKMVLLRGLVVLWTTEKVYLDAWLYAAGTAQGGRRDATEDEDGGALRTAFIPNWTSDEFKVFVEEIRSCLNELAGSVVRQQGDEGHGRLDDAVREVAGRGFRQVLLLEEGFWPVVQSSADL